MPLGSEMAMVAASCWTETFWLMSTVRLPSGIDGKRLDSVWGQLAHYLRYDLARTGIVDVDDSLQS